MTTPEAIAGIELALQHAAQVIAELAAAVVTLHSIAADDRDFIGALAGDVNRHEDRIGQLTEELDTQSGSLAGLTRVVHDRTDHLA